MIEDSRALCHRNPSHNYVKRLEADVQRLSETVGLLQAGQVPNVDVPKPQPQASTSSLSASQIDPSVNEIPSDHSLTSSPATGQADPRRLVQGKLIHHPETGVGTLQVFVIALIVCPRLTSPSSFSLAITVRPHFILLILGKS